jgi:hypothetical protein
MSGVPYERLDAQSLLRVGKEWNPSPGKMSLEAEVAQISVNHA